MTFGSPPLKQPRLDPPDDSDITTAASLDTALHDIPQNNEQDDVPFWAQQLFSLEDDSADESVKSPPPMDMDDVSDQESLDFDDYSMPPEHTVHNFPPPDTDVLSHSTFPGEFSTATLRLPCGIVVDPISSCLGKLIFKPNNPARIRPKIGPRHQVDCIPSIGDPDTCFEMSFVSLDYVPFSCGVVLPTTELPTVDHQDFEEVPRKTFHRFGIYSRYRINYPSFEERIFSPKNLRKKQSQFEEFLTALKACCGTCGFSLIPVFQLMARYKYNFEKIRLDFLAQKLGPEIRHFGHSRYGLPIVACQNTRKYFELSWSEDEFERFTDMFIDYGRKFYKYLAHFPSKTVADLYDFFMRYWRDANEESEYLLEADKERVSREQVSKAMNLEFLLQRHAPSLYLPQAEPPASSLLTGTDLQTTEPELIEQFKAFDEIE
ncbi:hypothetical protein RCL1_006963 [Eukaryota sp. TZLM3-RCL]